MAKSVYLILILSVFTFSNVKAHEYYVSVCTIDYNMKTKGLELTFKIIAHDVEKSILENEKVDLKLGSEKEAASANEILHQYIDKHFGISIAGAKKELKYVGKEVELDESLYLYFEIENVDQVNDFVLTNTILIEKFPKQENIVHLNISKAGQSVVFSKDVTSKEIDI